MSKINKLVAAISAIFKPLKNLSTTGSHQSSFPRNMQNFVLIWLDANINEVNNDCHNTITQLRKIVNTINTFIDANQCINFVTEIKDEKIFIIISGSLGEHVVPVICDMPQIDSIYIFCQNEVKHKQWAEQWPKVKGIFTEIPFICEVLKQDAEQCDQNGISISFVSADERVPNQNLDQFNPSFMYTQILKEILLTIDFNEQSMIDFISYCREQFADNAAELRNIDKLEREYHEHTPIWWYTYECFLYSMINRALRTMEVDIIIKMGFFLRDLHQHIVQLHSEQYIGHRKGHSFTVYRGQGLSKEDFNQMKKTSSGLISFNNFLSTSKTQNVSLDFARRSLLNPDLTGVLFVITVDPSSLSTPFASIKHVSYYQTEREIVFSMHSVFRISHINQIDHNNNRLWQVDLTLISDDDHQRRDLTQWIREKTQAVTGWHRLGQLLIILGQFTKAEDLYKILIEQSYGESEKAHIYHDLGVIKDGQGDYEMAIHYYEKSLEINTNILSQDHPKLASTYSGIGLVYSKKGDYIKALSSLETALEIFRKNFPPRNSHLAISYGNIGKVYDAMGEHSVALTYHERALEIFQETLSPDHQYISTCCCDIGKVYNKMCEFSKALGYHQRALTIRKKTLPSNHPLLAASYNSIGEVYVKMGEYSKGLPHIEHSIELAQRSLPPNHPDLELYRKSLNTFHQTF